jgi:hypothetical protein
MAKIKLGAIVVAMSGKLGGHVFAKNRGGAYMRTKVTPSNPQSTAQMSVRGAFASISSSWSGLTAAARESFNSFVNAYQTTDIFGDIKNPSGKTLFQRLNQNLSNSGQALIATCVAPTEVPFAGLTSAIFDISGTSFDAATSGTTTGSQIIAFATPPLSQGTTFVKNRLRQLVVKNGGVGVQVDMYAAYVAKYGVPVVGANIYIAVKVVNANGQASPLETVKAVVQA